MNPKDLPLVGVIENGTGHDFFGSYSKLEGKKLLCIGLSESEVESFIAPHHPAAITMLTNWADHIDARVSRYPLVIGDITKRTAFDDDAFDAILTLSVLEHLNDLRDAFKEMVRLVRPGGEMLHMFGPAWSCAYGHHLYVDAGDPNLNFSMWRLPAHMHLLCSATEVTDYYLGLGYPLATIEWVTNAFYKPSIINCEFYDEYSRLLAGDSFQIDRMELMYNTLPKDHMKRLRTAYPGRVDFSTYGGRYRLIVRKP